MLTHLLRFFIATSHCFAAYATAAGSCHGNRRRQPTYELVQQFLAAFNRVARTTTPESVTWVKDSGRADAVR